MTVFASFVAGVLFTIGEYALGILIKHNFPGLRFDGCLYIMLALLLACIALNVWHIIRVRCDVDIEEVNGDSHNALGRLKLTIIFTRAYIACLAIITGALALMFAMKGGAVFAVCCMPLSLINSLLAYKLVFAKHISGSSAVRVDGFAEKFPVLHALISEVFGAKARIAILPKGDFRMAVAQLGRYILLELGVFAVVLLNRNEFKQLLLHEKGHLEHGEPKLMGDAKRLLACVESYEGVLSMPDKLLFFWFEYKLLLSIQNIRKVPSLNAERIADDYVLAHGDTKAYVNALAKSRLFSLVDSHEIQFLVYESVSPRKDATRRAYEFFLNTAREREAFYRDIMHKELPSPMDTHPTFVERWERFGKPEYSFDFCDRDEEFAIEGDNYMRYVDEKIEEKLSEDYDKKRKAEYLDHLSTIEEYEQTMDADSAIPPRAMVRVIHAYQALSRYDEMLVACERSIRAGASPAESAHAHMAKALLLLNRFDTAGIEEAYIAMDNNSNFALDALNAVKNFCKELGLARELDECNKRHIRYQQTRADLRDRDTDIAPNEKLEADDLLPEAIQRENLEFIIQALGDALISLYAVKRVVTRDFVQTAYIISFSLDVDSDALTNALQRIFLYLDTRPDAWNYGLFLMTESLKKRLDRVPGALLYAR